MTDAHTPESFTEKADRIVRDYSRGGKLAGTGPQGMARGMEPKPPLISRRTYQYGARAGTVLRWEWHGGEYIDVFYGDDEIPFHAINTTGADGVLPEFTKRNFQAEIKAGPTMRALIEEYEASR